MNTDFNEAMPGMSTVAVTGRGYVGLPLVVAFGQQMRTIGFDIAQHKGDACLADRRINNGLGKFIAERTIKLGALVDVKAFDQVAVAGAGLRLWRP